MARLLQDTPPSFEILDPSQSRAVAHALQNSVAIIQGPPGCGKTRTGVTLLGMLLETDPEIRGPIIITAYRNKALDDITGKAMAENPNREFARLGKKPVEPHNLRDLRLLDTIMKYRPTEAYREAAKRNNEIAATHNKRVGRMYNLALRHSGEPETILRQLNVAVSGEDLGALRQVYDPKGELTPFEAIAAWVVGPAVGMRERPLDSGWVVSRDPPEDSKLPPRLQKSVKAIRRQIDDRVRRAKWSELGEAIGLADEMIELVEGAKRGMTAAALQTMDVIATTVTYLNINRLVFEELRPKIVIFEEAGEVLDPLAITALPSSVEHIILLGDHQQLAPRVQVRALLKRGFGVSLMQRLVRVGIPSVRLDYQNRMRPELAEPLRGIYPGLRDGAPTRDIAPIGGLEHSIFWWDVDGEESPAYSNRDEALAVWACAGMFLQLGVPGSDIRILTPYSEQERVIQGLRHRHDKSHHFQDVRVVTVDSFQGSERSVIIASLVRSNPEGKIGFLSDPRRRCVALSRARAALVLVGNSKTICVDKGWKSTHKVLAQRECSNSALPFHCPVHSHRR